MVGVFGDGYKEPEVPTDLESSPDLETFSGILNVYPFLCDKFNLLGDTFFIHYIIIYIFYSICKNSQSIY